MNAYPWWTEEQIAFQKEVHEFTKTMIERDAVTRLTREFPTDVFEEIGRRGFLGAAIPKEYGGLGLGCTGSCILAEELHSWSPGIGRILVGNMNGGLRQIIEHGTEEQKHRFLPEIAAGVTGAVVITETLAGTDAAGISLKAERVGDKYILNGRKRFIVGAGVADRYFVFARTSNDPEDIKKRKHLTAFIVRKGAPGFSVEKINEILAFENIQNGSLDFENVEVDIADRIGEEGEAFKIMMGGLNFERTNIAASTVGWQRLVLRNCVPYAQRRVQFGKPIIDMSTNQDKIANIVMRLNSMRNNVYIAAYRWDREEDITIDASAIKCQGVEMALASAEEAVQIMGGDGVNTFYPVKNVFEVSKTEHVAGGTVEACRMTIFRSTLKKMKEDIEWVRRMIDPETGFPVPTYQPVEEKMAPTAENLLKVLGEDYRVNQGLHMTVEDIQWYIDGSADEIQAAAAELVAAGDALILPDRKTGKAKLVRASYDGINKAFPKEHYKWAPAWVTPDRTF